MKAWDGNDTNMFVVSIYFLLKKKKRTSGIEEDPFFRILTDTCALLGENPTWDSWLSGHKKSCLFFYSWFKNKRITEGLSHRITCAKPNFQSLALDKTLESGYSWDLWWEENLHFTDAEVRRIKILSMLTSPGFHEQGPTRTQLFLATKLYHIWG